MRLLGIFALFVFLGPGSAVAQTSADIEREARARGLFEELRCLVCEGQSLAQSQAPLAQDMRQLIRERLASGQSEDEIRAYLRARYGDYIFLHPPANAATFLLWAGPFLFLILGAVGGAIVVYRLRRTREGAYALSESEEKRLAERLSGERNGL